MNHALVLVLSATAIYLGSELFVNAIEWLGVILRVGTVAVGTVLAAAGTALPETLITLIAVTGSHGTSGADIGLGAALAGPLVLSTLAFGVAGGLLWRRKGRDGLSGVGPNHLHRSLTIFLSISIPTMALGFIDAGIKRYAALVLLVAYALYVRHELRSASDDAHSADDLQSLRLWRKESQPPNLVIVVQCLLSVAVIVIGSHFFVGAMENLGPALGLAPTAVALLLSPLATELPELLNVVIWVRQDKGHLSVANVGGALVAQATIPAAIALWFTPWQFDPALTGAAATIIVTTLYVLVVVRGRRFTPPFLAATLVPYVIFAASVIVSRG